MDSPDERHIVSRHVIDCQQAHEYIPYFMDGGWFGGSLLPKVMGPVSGEVPFAV
jgi:hypothetical protein